MINVTNEPSDTHIKSLKEEILEYITEKFMEKMLDMINQNVQDILKKFHDIKNKEHEKTQKQINELREDFNKQQSETKDTIKREIHELKMATQNIKEELKKKYGKPQKKIIEQKSWK
jgi:archaellum component FlaC